MGKCGKTTGEDKIWSSATVDTLWEKDSGVWLYKPNEEACERGLRVNGKGLCEVRATAAGSGEEDETLAKTFSIF